MYKVSFIVLHYEVINDTIECIESILENIQYDEYSIIVVDNFSKNKSGYEIKNKYKRNNKIKILLNNENLGFARGNNIGYAYAKHELKSDFIILINNDTIIRQKSFVELLIKKYENDRYAVLGPDVISLKDGGHQNPQRLIGISRSSLVKQILIKFRMFLVLNYLGVEDLIRDIYRLVKRKKSNTINKEGYETEKIGVQLNGCCLIFSPIFVEKYEGLNPNTFMYMEEDILFYTCKKDGMKSIYYPKIQIYHKEDSATTLVCKKDSIKRRFYYRNSIKSANILYKLMIKDR